MNKRYMQKKPTLLVLAAGLGSRYGGVKQIDSIGPAGERIIDYSVYDAVRAGFGKIVYVVNQEIEKDFQKHVIDEQVCRIPIEYVLQDVHAESYVERIGNKRQKPWGTGQALLSASEVINEPFAVINADDFYGADSFHKAVEFLNGQNSTEVNEYALVGFKLKNTLSLHGSVSRGICEVTEENMVSSVVERTRISIENERIYYSDSDEDDTKHLLSGDELVSMNMWLFTPSVFDLCEKEFKAFLDQFYDDSEREFYLPTMVNSLIKHDLASVKLLETDSTWFGLTYKEDKSHVIEMLNELIASGKYPECLWGNNE